MATKISEFLLNRDKVKKLARKQDHQLLFARQFLAGLVQVFSPSSPPSPVLPITHPLAAEMGEIAKALDIEMAAYLIGTTYTVMLPDSYRGEFGVYYTPPALVERLLDLSEQNGIDWAAARVLDPACGGGAFLAPVAQRITTALSHLCPEERLSHIETHLHGFELDPFSAWISQVFLEKALENDLVAVGRPLQPLIEVGDSLDKSANIYSSYDLVIGNPPYGKVKLTKAAREKWGRSLFGHANLYGLFSDLAARLVRPGGTIAYVTPTSFLGGQYFQALRGLLGREAPPIAIDFIAHREGVFADVLQEALLAVYRKQPASQQVKISYLSVKETGVLDVQTNGAYPLPTPPESPWILPRRPGQSDLACVSHQMPHRLCDLGYTVSTGPLVWNRHKDQLLSSKEEGVVPLIWAECVDSESTGRFTFKATARNHVPWYRPIRDNDPNIVRAACILLQRTTSLEQPREMTVISINVEDEESLSSLTAVQ